MKLTEEEEEEMIQQASKVKDYLHHIGIFLPTYQYFGVGMLQREEGKM